MKYRKLEETRRMTEKSKSLKLRLDRMERRKKKVVKMTEKKKGRKLRKQRTSRRM